MDSAPARSPSNDGTFTDNIEETSSQRHARTNPSNSLTISHTPVVSLAPHSIAPAARCRTVPSKIRYDDEDVLNRSAHTWCADGRFSKGLALGRNDADGQGGRARWNGWAWMRTGRRGKVVDGVGHEGQEGRLRTVVLGRR